MVNFLGHDYLFQRTQAQELPDSAALAGAGSAAAELCRNPRNQLVHARHARHGRARAELSAAARGPGRGAARACDGAGTRRGHGAGAGTPDRAQPQLHAQRPGMGLRPLLPLLSPRSGGAGGSSAPDHRPAARLDWLREAVCIGSLGRKGAITGDRADLDLRLLFRPDPQAGCGSTCCCWGCAPRHSAGAFRSTSTPMSGRSGCAGSTSASPCCCCSTVTKGWRGCTGGGPWPGRERALDRDPPHLLGLLARRPSRRAGAGDGGHPVYRPVRRDLRRRAAAAGAAAPHPPDLPSAPFAAADPAQCDAIARHRAARTPPGRDLDRSRRRRRDLHPRPAARRQADLHRDRGRARADAGRRLVYPFADLFVVQWPDKAAGFPRAVLASGPLL